MKLRTKYDLVAQVSKQTKADQVIINSYPVKEIVCQRITHNGSSAIKQRTESITINRLNTKLISRRKGSFMQYLGLSPTGGNLHVQS